MTRTAVRLVPFLFLLAVILGARPALAQNPVQWSGSVKQSVDRAHEQMLPLLFWVSGERGGALDDDELEDAQEECFRDPVVVDIIRRQFVAVRVSRSSRMIEEAEKLGLPTQHGLYCAVMTDDGRLLDQMGPGEVADPAAFAAHLSAAFSKYRDDLYERELRPVLEDPGAAKSKVRLAAQTVWRLGIRSADGAVIGLLARPDLKPNERARIYALLASLGTQKSIAALLERSGEPEAVAALSKAEAGALEWLTPELPGAEGEPTAGQMAAYRATVQICRAGSLKAEAWWAKASAEERQKEAERVGSKAQTVLEYWKESGGAAK